MCCTFTFGSMIHWMPLLGENTTSNTCISEDKRCPFIAPKSKVDLWQMHYALRIVEVGQSDKHILPVCTNKSHLNLAGKSFV